MVTRLNFKPQEMVPAPEGGFSERDLFGTINTRDSKYIEAAKKAWKDPNRPYIEFRDAMNVVKAFQPGGGSKNPEKDFLNNLRIEVADRLGLESDDDLEKIGAFTAIGWPEKTQLDVFHGVDAFITFGEAGRDEIVVTLDGTENPEKMTRDIKADVVVFGPDLPDPNEDEEGYLKAVGKYADKIAKEIIRKMSLNKPPERKHPVHGEAAGEAQL